MSVNKRLEELKWFSAARALTREEAWWLIETVEKQQQEIKDLNREIGGHSGTLDAITEEFNFLTGRLKELQNKMVNQ